MIKINLLPLKKKIDIKRILSISVFALSIVALLLFSFLVENQKKHLESKLSDIKKENLFYEKIVKEISQIITEKKNREQRIRIIEILDSERMKSVDLLETVSSNLVTGKMWLTYLASSKDSVNIKGVAINNKTAADFLKQLENSEYFASVDLKRLKQITMYNNPNLKNFEILCVLKSIGEKVEKRTCKPSSDPVSK